MLQSCPWEPASVRVLSSWRVALLAQPEWVSRRVLSHPLIVVAALFFGLWHQSLDAGMALFGVLMFLEIRLP